MYPIKTFRDNDKYLESCLDDLVQIYIPNNTVIQQGIIVLTGGKDNTGKSLIVFPIEMHLKIQINDVTEIEMFEALQYYLYEINSVELSFLIDFRAASSIIIDKIMNSINEFQSKNPNLQLVFYGIQSQDSKLNNLIRKRMHLKSQNIFKPIFQSSNIPVKNSKFQNILVKTSTELYNYINQSNLTNEFGGQLQYDHSIWLLMKQDVFNNFKKILSMKSIFMETKEKLFILKEYHAKDQFSIDKNIERLQMSYDNIMKQTKLETLIQESDTLLRQITLSILNDEILRYHLLKGNPHLEKCKHLVIKLIERLKQIEIYFQNIFKDIKGKFNITEELKKFTNFASEELYWIQEIGIPFLNSDPTIALNSEQAESLARKFHHNIYVPGITCLAKCEEITKIISKSLKPTNENIDKANYAKISQKLLFILSQFKSDLHVRRKLYSDIYQFHCVVIITMKWLKKTIKNLPIDLLDYNENMKSDDIIKMSDVWKNKIRQYELKNPLPKPTQISLIEKILEIIPDINIRNEARMLVYRLKILLRLLKCINVANCDIKEVIDWKYQLKLDDNMKTVKENFKKSPKFVKRNIQSPINKRIHEKPIKIVNDSFKNRENNDSDKLKNINFFDDIIEKKKDPIYLSQPNLTVQLDHQIPNHHRLRNKQLIELAEKTVSESLRNANLISEKDLRIPKYQNDEDELSMILNQLLYDINSSFESLSDNNSSNISGIQNIENDLNDSFLTI